jgi:hypothetical protein
MYTTNCPVHSRRLQELVVYYVPTGQRHCRVEKHLGLAHRERTKDLEENLFLSSFNILIA